MKFTSLENRLFSNVCSCKKFHEYTYFLMGVLHIFWNYKLLVHRLKSNKRSISTIQLSLHLEISTYLLCSNSWFIQGISSSMGYVLCRLARLKIIIASLSNICCWCIKGLNSLLMAIRAVIQTLENSRGQNYRLDFRI